MTEDVFTRIMREEGVDFPEAVRIAERLAAHADPRQMSLPDVVSLDYARGYSAGLEASYFDDGFPERECDHCGKPYRGPAVYCSLECALADA
jgi:hypothetical protein